MTNLACAELVKRSTLHHAADKVVAHPGGLTKLGAVVGCVWQAQQCRGNSTVKADFRPVLSSILNDYMFRCPSWRAAHLLQEKSRPGVPVYVYQFSHPTRVGASPYTPKHMGQRRSLVHRESLSDYRPHAAAHILVDNSGVLWD